VLAALTAFAPVYAAGCNRSTATVAAVPYNAPELEIQVQEIKLDDEKLQFKLMFVNRTQSVMQVDRNQIKLVAGGRTLTRFTGRFGGMTSGIHTIGPAMSHAVFVDYIVGEGFAGPATLALSQGGVIVNGAPLPLPDFTVNVGAAE
jgi:hypothetical protein